MIYYYTASIKKNNCNKLFDKYFYEFDFLSFYSTFIQKIQQNHCYMKVKFIDKMFDLRNIKIIPSSSARISS